MKKKYGKYDYFSLPVSLNELGKLRVEAQKDGCAEVEDLCLGKMADIESGAYDYRMYERAMKQNDAKSAIQHLKRAAEKGHYTALGEYGDAAYMGWQMPQDCELAARYYRLSAENCNLPYIMKLCDMYENRLIAVETEDQRLDALTYWLFVAKELGDAEAEKRYQEISLTAKWIYRMLAVYADASKAMERQEKEGDAAVAPAIILAAVYGWEVQQFNAGVCYRRGLSVKANEQLAMLFYQAAARNNVQGAERAVGYMYMDEYAIYHKNVDRGIKILRKLAKDGDGKAAYELGRYYINISAEKNDEEVEKNCAESRKWYMLCEKLNHPRGTYMLAQYYLEGIGGSSSFELGEKMMVKAAKLGEVDAMAWCADRQRKREARRGVKF